MADGYRRKFPADQGDKTKERITTGCQYCAVGCGYNAFLVPKGLTEGEEFYDGVSRFITPPMTNTVNFRGQPYKIAVAPDARCDLNKGNHSVRGGSQGENLVSHNGSGRSTQDRLTSPMVRVHKKDDPRGELKPITWEQLNEIIAALVIRATKMKIADDGFDRRIEVTRPEQLGVKLYEYQYLENTFAATKLFYSAIGTPNVAYHDRPSAAGSSPGMKDAGLRPHDFSYDEVREADLLVFIGTNPYENHSVFFMQHCQGKEMIVIDPRRTATAQYAEETGGLHLQPKQLGADSLLLYAVARELLVRWKAEHGNLDSFPWRDRIATAETINGFRNPKPNEGEKGKAERERRASRAADFDTFANGFLKVDTASSPYTLAKARTATKIKLNDLQLFVSKLLDVKQTAASEQPKVAIFYEKGMIWGFNYHNTAAVASLGLLLGAYTLDDEQRHVPGRFVGRVGGHQKGWAAAKINLDHTFSNHTGWSGGTNEGYPFRNAEDKYGDNSLRDTFGAGTTIKVHHNLDNHVFGVPPDFDHEDQDAVPYGFVLLKNGLVTRRNPDVRLLWIIGGNYLGQTNDAQYKQKALMRRLRAGGSRQRIVDRPKSEKVDEVVRVLGRRMEASGAKGIVLVHQEVFANPTTELCDIVIPAAGWGEDTFCRYNAQRRLKLYDRFQDIPLHPKEKKGTVGSPANGHKFKHSPKPDWMIIRDIALAVARQLDNGQASATPTLEEKVGQIFFWKDSSQVADDMAEFSIRGKSGSNILGDLLDFGQAQGVDSRTVHEVLGMLGDAQGKNGDGVSGYLQGKYIATETQHTNENVSEIYGNGIASNGVMLPVRYDSQTETLKGTLSNVPGGPFTFVRADWSEIKACFDEANEKSGDPDELFVTNGRFNHLWNNMFHHLRNEYVNERYPEDLPGTILELNPKWAKARSISSGDVVEVKADGHSFLGVASLQESVPPEGAFAMFSYPVRELAGGDLVFNFDGYCNNITYRYADGINPIAALKYGRAVVKKAEKHKPYSSPRLTHPDVKKRIGPTYLPRNQVGPHIRPVVSADPDQREAERLDWEMRELIVRRGLPRAKLRRAFAAAIPHDTFWKPFDDGQYEAFLGFQHPRFSGPVRDVLAGVLTDPAIARMPQNMLMPRDFPNGFPPWEQSRLDRIADLIGLLKTAGEPDHLQQQRFKKLKSALDDLLGLPHRVVTEYFFRPSDFRDLLATNPSILQRLDERLNDLPTDPRRMMWRDASGGLIDEWRGADLQLAKAWIEAQKSQNGGGDPRSKMTELLKAKAGTAQFVHNGIDADGKTLSDRFKDEEYEQILDFLENGVSQRAPHTGEPLVVPGSIAESAFFQQITGGVMAGQFEGEGEKDVVESWINSLTSEEPDLNRFEKVKKILDDSVDNQDFAAHGRFWVGKTRDEFVALSIFGQQLLIEGDGAGSNLVKALKGESPFGSDTGTTGAFFRRMPGGRDPIADADIAAIEQWIDDGCPDDPAPASGEIDADAGGPLADPAAHNDYWREFDNWAMFQASPEVNNAIGQVFNAAPNWMAFAKDPAQENAWQTAITGSDATAAFTLLANRQRETVRAHYGAPVELLTLLDSYERFGDDSLPDDPLRPADDRHNMNGPTMWFFWSAFHDACLRLGLNDEYWNGHSRALLLGLMNDGLFRGRYTVNGFSADAAGKEAMRTHVRGLPDDQLQAELAKRFVDSGF